MSDRQSGFTLVELLSALIIAALLLSLISLTLWSVQSRNTAVEQTSDILQAKEHAARFLQSTLINAVSYHPNGSDAAFMRGTPTSLSFFAPAPAALETQGLLRYDIDAEGQTGRPQLVMHSALPWTPKFKTASAVFAPFEDLRFAYLMPPQDARADPEWSATWQDKAALPLAIKVTASLRKDRSETLDMLIKLRRPIDPHCRFDSLSRGCVT